MPQVNTIPFKARGYLHFDSPISSATARSITDPEAVIRHGFYPLVQYHKETQKVWRNPETDKLETVLKRRPISYAAHADSAIYRHYAHLLRECYETSVIEYGLNDVVLAFRNTGKNNIHCAKTAFDAIREMGDCAAIGLDIEKFFDNIDHGILKQQWCKLLDTDQLPQDHYAVFRSITRYSWVDRQALYQLMGISRQNPRKGGRYRLCSSEEFRNKVRPAKLIHTNKQSYGLPQGLPVSALLSNVYMGEFDQLMVQAVALCGGRYFRYCDDMLFIVPTDKKELILNMAQLGINQLKLSISEKKTEIREFRKIDGELMSDKPLQYLGFAFDGQRTLLRAAGLARYSRKVKRGVRLAKSTKRKHNRLRRELGHEQQELYKRKLYERYSHLGKRNFITYGYRAAGILESRAIKKQLKPLWKRLDYQIEGPVSIFAQSPALKALLEAVAAMEKPNRS